MTMATTPRGTRAATKNASVTAPAPKRDAMAMSSTSPDTMAAEAATVVSPDWRTRPPRLGGRAAAGAAISAASDTDLNRSALPGRSVEPRLESGTVLPNDRVDLQRPHLS